MTKDPERTTRRANAAAALGITEEALLEQRRVADAANLERKAKEAGVPVERYLEERRRHRNQLRRARRTR